MTDETSVPSLHGRGDFPNLGQGRKEDPRVDIQVRFLNY